MCDHDVMEPRISLVTLGVNNLSSARAIYEALGWGGAEQHGDEVCFFQAGGMVFGLWTALGGHGAPGIELAYNVRSPDEVSEILDEAQRAGGNHRPPGGGGGLGWYIRRIFRPRRLRVGGGSQSRLDLGRGRNCSHIVTEKRGCFGL